MPLVRRSRPLFWLFTGGLFLLGALIGAVDIAWVVPWTSVSFLCVWAWFAVGENIVGVFINDYCDREADRVNPRKKERWDAAQEAALFVCIAVAAGAFGVMAVEVGGVMLWVYGLIFFFGTFVYNVPPVRLKGRPFLDLIIGPASGLPPLFAGYSLVAHRWPSVWAVALGVLVFGALEFLDKVFDAQADRAAGLTTTAVWLGWRGNPARQPYVQWGLAALGTLVSCYVWYLYLSL